MDTFHFKNCLLLILDILRREKNVDTIFSIKEVFCYYFFHTPFSSFRPNKMKATS